MHFFKKFPFYKQLDTIDCGATCLKMIAEFYGRKISIQYLREKSVLTKQGASLIGIMHAGEEIGLKTLPLNIDFDTLKNNIPFPFIAHWRKRHYIVVYNIKRNRIYIADPAFGRLKMHKDDFLKGWLYNKNEKTENINLGYILVLEPTPIFYSQESKKAKTYNIFILKSYVKQYNKQLIQIFLSLLLTTILISCMPFFTKQLVDIGIVNKDVSLIVIVLLGQFVFYFSQTLLDVVRRWYLLIITRKVRVLIISDLLKKMLNIPISFFNSKTQGDLIQRLDDQLYIEQFLTGVFLNAFLAIINISVFGSIMLYYNWRYFLAFLIGITLYIIWIKFFVRERTRLSYLRRDQTYTNRNSILQMLNGIHEIKLNNSNNKRRREWESIQSQLLSIAQKELAYEQIQTIGGNFIIQITYLIITAISAIAVVHGVSSLGTMLALQFIIGQLSLPISSFVSLLQNYKEAKISIERMGEIFEEKEDKEEDKLSDSILDDEKDIIIKNVSFKYNILNSNYVLKDINLTIPFGKTTAIVGTSGSGKTSLLNLLLKFYKPQSGEIYYGEKNIDEISDVSWRKQCGVVLQNGFIFSDTILRNITESSENYTVDKKALYNATEIANIQELIDNLPLGYQTTLGFSGITLSGGENQRILIARCIYKNPKMIFFDEATSALDAYNEKIIISNLNDFFKGKTVIIVAHRLSTVKHADNVVVIDKGRIIEQGTHFELIENKGKYYELIKNQLELGV